MSNEKLVTIDNLSLQELDTNSEIIPLLSPEDELEMHKENLPEDTIIARIAGDEFCFLTPNAHKSDIDKNFRNIQNILYDNREKNYGLTITTSSMDSSFYPEFDDMYFHTELDVTRQKKINSKKQ